MESPTAALIRASFDAFNAGDTERLLQAVSLELVMHLAESPEPVRGRDAWLAGFQMMRGAFPDLAVEIEELVAEGDRVAARLRLRGTHTGDFLQFPATGGSVEYVSHEFYRVADGVIVEEWICSDMASLFQQLT